MEEGMTFTVEPIVAQGQEDVLILEDGWTAVMVDNGRAAQFEHTVLITESGHEILTAWMSKEGGLSEEEVWYDFGVKCVARSAMVDECRVAHFKHYIFIIEGHKIPIAEGHKKM